MRMSGSMAPITPTSDELMRERGGSTAAMCATARQDGHQSTSGSGWRASETNEGSW